MLFEADRHEAPSGAPWEAQVVARAIRGLGADFESALDAGGHWPAHALDLEGEQARPFHSLYLGAAGVLWALWHLERAGAVELRIAPDALIRRAYDDYLAAPDTGAVVPSYYLGEVGILLVRWRLTGDAAAAERLYTLIRDNIPNPTNEALWAAPGTMVGALHMLEWTGDERWRSLFLDNVEQLWKTWLPSPYLDGHLWTQDLYGSIVQLLGAGHGYAGNVYPLLRGAALMPAERRDALLQRCADLLGRTALRDGDGVNWPPGVGPTRPGRASVLVQWCHGAPGIVTATADFPRGVSAAMDRLLLDAGATIWRAGPLVKGYGLCHGTAGNGYAFLKLYRRTGDANWLARARAFAMHALGQRERMRARYGVGRYSLWTGDAGLAVYLQDCIDGTDRMPGLDRL